MSDSDSDSVDSTFPENDKYVKKPFIEAGKSILNTTSASNLVNPTIPQEPPLYESYKINARRDAVFARQQANFDDLQAKLSRQQQNSFYNTEARLEVVTSDAEKRAEIIALFKKFAEDNPPPKARVTIDENQNKLVGVKRKYMGDNVLTVEEKRRQQSRVVADKVSDILFKLLKDIQPEEVNTKIDELIANASQVNKSFKRSDDELTVRQVNNLKNAGLFDDAIKMTFDKLNRYKKPDTAAAYTKGIIDIDSDKEKLSSWLFDTTTEGGYSRSKTIKRSKKSKKKRSSKKLTKRIRSLKQSKKRSKKTKK